MALLPCLAGVRAHFSRTWMGRILLDVATPAPVSDRGISHVVPAFILAAVAAHGDSPVLCDHNGQGGGLYPPLDPLQEAVRP